MKSGMPLSVPFIYYIHISICAYFFILVNIRKKRIDYEKRNG